MDPTVVFILIGCAVYAAGVICELGAIGLIWELVGKLRKPKSKAVASGN